MPQRSPIRISVLVLTFAVFGTCLLLLYHYRPASPATNTGANSEPVPSPVPSDNPGRFSQAVAARSLSHDASAGLPPKAGPPVVIAQPPRNLQPDDLYRALQESSDPQEKRRLRKQLASIKPGEVPFRFALEKYASASNDEEKLHLQSIVGQIDVSDFAREVGSVASQTLDESLFVSLAYALRNSKDVEAKQELFQLVASNRLPAVRTNSLMSNQGLVALHRCLLDTLQTSDLAWINQYATTNPLNAVQLSIVNDFMARTNGP